MTWNCTVEPLVFGAVSVVSLTALSVQLFQTSHFLQMIKDLGMTLQRATTFCGLCWYVNLISSEIAADLGFRYRFYWFLFRGQVIPIGLDSWTCFALYIKAQPRVKSDCNRASLCRRPIIVYTAH